MSISAASPERRISVSPGRSPGRLSFKEKDQTQSGVSYLPEAFPTVSPQYKKLMLILIRLSVMEIWKVMIVPSDLCQLGGISDQRVPII